MMPRASLTLSLTMIVPLLASGFARADVSGPKAEYSADSFFETAEMRMKGKVHHAPGKERREMNVGGGQQIMIVRWDRNVAWMLMPSEKMYMETPLQQGETDPSGYRIEKAEVVGQETIEGLNTTKSKVIVADAEGNKFDGFTWVTKDGITMKMDAVGIETAAGRKTRMKMELKNLQIGKQDPRLFEIPSGYTKIGMSGLAPGGMPDLLKQRGK